MSLTAKFRISGHFQGVFLLKGDADCILELSDDLYLGDAHRYVAGVDFLQISERVLKRTEQGHAEPFLTYRWEKDGTGFVVNHLRGGQELFTSFSRFVYVNDKTPSGLFVGGGLPDSVKENRAPVTNKTGMAFYDGSSWHHIWCTANEAIVCENSSTLIYPDQWKYLGSKVLHADNTELIIKSSHMVELDHVPLQIDRFARFKAGETFFTLSISVANMGAVPVLYAYLYGDEPWLGNYGSSGGNIGWVKDRLITHEGPIDTEKYSYAGMFDYGNRAIGEKHNCTMTANFIEWMSVVSPTVYFANSVTKKNDPPQPLQGNERFLGIQWHPPELRPGKVDSYFLAIGMAGRDQTTGLPVKPKTNLYP